jgi:Rrf2 family nitric oxide-sensitive transcriptional repressor
MPAEKIRVGEIVRMGERAAPLVECFDAKTNRCAITPACFLKSVLKDAEMAFYEVLDKVTVRDLVRRPREILAHLNLH